MKNKRRQYGDTFAMTDAAGANADLWRFLLFEQTAVLQNERESMFVASGDLLILRPQESALIPQGAAFGIAVSASFVHKCLELYGGDLFEKWEQCDSLLLTLSTADEYRKLLQSVMQAEEGYTRSFLSRQFVVGCIAEAVRKAKYGRQVLPPVVASALKLLTTPAVLAAPFPVFCKATGMSERNLSRLFLRYGLETPSEELRKAKLAYAKECMEKGLAKKETAAKIGYSVGGFAKVYKEYYGEFPQKQPTLMEKEDSHA